jgi:hypothetical protein
MKTTRILGIALALLLPLVAPAALNEGVITYSGFLHKADATAETAPQTLVFTLYDAATLGNVLWTQTVNSGPLDSVGWFSVVLGASPSAFPPDGFLSQTWLGIKVGAEAEMTPRTKIGAAPHALSVDHAGVSGCAAANQILQWSGTAWTCIATPAGGGGGGVTGVTATAPLASSGGTAPVISMGANPTFTGTVTATTFAGSLSGNAATATTAASVAANSVTPSDLNAVVAPATGQVAAKASGTDTFTWISPLAPPPAACGAGTGTVLSWNGTALVCVADANTVYTAGAGLTLSGTQFAPAFTAAGGNSGVATTVARGDHNHDFGVAGTQVADFTNLVSVTGAVTTLFPTSSVTVAAGTSNRVVLNAHLYAEKAAVSTFARYNIYIIRSTTCVGVVAGYTYYRPPSFTASSADSWVGESVAITGTDLGVSGTQTYTLCVGKADTVAPDLSIGPRGITATWSR